MTKDGLFGVPPESRASLGRKTGWLFLYHDIDEAVPEVTTQLIESVCPTDGLYTVIGASTISCATANKKGLSK